MVTPPARAALTRPGAAEHGVGAELQRVQEFVVDPFVDHVHALLAGRGAHVDAVAAADEVPAFHKFHAHQAGQQGVLEVGAVEDPGGQDHHGGIVDAGGRRFAQGRQQPAGVLFHRADELLAEGLRQALGHGAPVLQDVADAGGHAHVVLQDPERPGGVTDHVDAGNVHPDAAGRFEAVHLAVEVRAGGDELARDHAVGHNVHFVVDVVEEGLKGPHALCHAFFQHGPFVGGDNARHDVERERALLPREVKGHAAVQERPRHRVRPGADIGEGKLPEGVRNLPV